MPVFEECLDRIGRYYHVARQNFMSYPPYLLYLVAIKTSVIWSPQHLILPTRFIICKIVLVITIDVMLPPPPPPMMLDYIQSIFA